MGETSRITLWQASFTFSSSPVLIHTDFVIGHWSTLLSADSDMPIPFGVSVGDFIAAIELIHTVVQALEESAGAGAHCRGVILSMKNLEKALSTLQNIESDDVVQKAAMLEIATHCSESIQRFFARVQKYQPALQLNGRKEKWKDALRKVQWTLLEKQEVRDFQAEIEGHVMSLHILLVQLQL